MIFVDRLKKGKRLPLKNMRKAGILNKELTLTVSWHWLYKNMVFSYHFVPTIKCVTLIAAKSNDSGKAYLRPTTEAVAFSKYKNVRSLLTIISINHSTPKKSAFQMHEIKLPPPPPLTISHLETGQRGALSTREALW